MHRRISSSPSPRFGSLVVALLLTFSMIAAVTPPRAALAAPVTGTVVTWGRDAATYLAPPAGLSHVTAIAAGYGHCLALTDDGTVVAWGHNGSGQTDVPAGLDRVVAIAAGYEHNLAVRADGTVVGWGNNAFGQVSIPPGLNDVTTVAAGAYHSLAVRADGSVVAWGRDDFGQAQVPAGLGNVTAVAAGSYFSVALKADGTVIAWGANDIGQTTVPAGLSDVTAIDAGGYHVLALRANGTVVAWGQNFTGEATIPPGLVGVIAIAAGSQNSLALKADGTLVAWGANGDGQNNIPPNLGHVLAIAAGGPYSAALVEEVETPLFEDTFAPGWGERWSWGVALATVSSPSYSGSASYSVRYTGAWGGFRIAPTAGSADLSAYDILRFAIHGGAAGGQRVKAYLNTRSGTSFDLGVVSVPAGRWAVVTLPLPADPALAATTELVWQEWTGKARPTLYLDRIELVGGTPPQSPGTSSLLDDGFAPGWGERWSWGATLAPGLTSPVASGSLSYGVTFTSRWGGFRIAPAAAADWTGYDSLRFAIHGGAAGGQRVRVYAVTAAGGQFELGRATAEAGKWTEVALPVPDNAALAAVTELVWQEDAGVASPTFYLDAVRLAPNT